MPKKGAIMDIFKTYGEWTFRLVVLAAIMANLWLTTNFVTRAEFQRDIVDLNNRQETYKNENTSQHLQIQSTIADISTTMKIMAQNQSIITDHESRLRLVEQRQTDVMARLKVIEQEHKRGMESDSGITMKKFYE